MFVGGIKEDSQRCQSGSGNSGGGRGGGLGGGGLVSHGGGSRYFAKPRNQGGSGGSSSSSSYGSGRRFSLLPGNSLAGQESQTSDREATGCNRFVNPAKHCGGRA
ncbi:unnamed protein product [Gulo gulo]|uniref:Uncharacterized protein n=1 Tax=Gulo gulo TaxID=48420 RepID=A0A9X9M0Q1_GULGU|nr:unnamed protein product [Gulo gulo]